MNAVTLHSSGVERVNRCERPQPTRPSTVEALERRALLSVVVVNTIIDGLFPPSTGIVSLRSAVAIANSSTTDTTITFDPTVFATPATIDLSQGTLTLSNSIATTTTLIGPAARLTIDGDAKGDVFDIDGGSANFSGITITNGGGRGINIFGNFEEFTLTNAVVSNNAGGGIACSFAEAFLTDVTISGNVAGLGGGIDTGNHGDAVLTDCTITGNSAISSSSTQGLGEGGGVYSTSEGGTTLVNCTITGNSAIGSGMFVEGGGIFNIGGLVVTNCTISGNTAPSGGGIAGEALPANVANSIIAGNTLTGSGGTSPDVLGPFTSHGFNLVGATDGSTGWKAQDLTGTAANPLNPLLAPLGNYGGPTQTMALLRGSPAVDHGSNAQAVDANGNPLTTDQRGLPRIFNGTVDIGAYEVQPPVLAGDVNHDNTVNFSDLVILVQHYGSNVPVYEDGDLNGDGKVNFADLVILAQNYGKSPASTAAAVFAAAQATSPQNPQLQSTAKGRKAKAHDFPMGNARSIGIALGLRRVLCLQVRTRTELSALSASTAVRIYHRG